MAVSSTVSPGIVLQDGQTVTISDLNKLGTPTVSIDGAVGTLSLTEGSVTNAIVASAAGIQLDKIQSGSAAQLVVANSSGVPTYVALSGDATISDAGALTLAADSVETAQITDANVTTGKLAANAVTAGKLDNLLTDGGGTAAEYTNCTITVDATGRISAVESGPSEPAGFEFEVITGNTTWTKPTGATLIRVVAIGGGGGGQGGGAGGGNGGAIFDWIDVSSVSSVAVTIGARGDGGTYGSSGGNTLFGSYLTANGGEGASGGTGADGTISGSQSTAEASSGLASTAGDGGAPHAGHGHAGVVVVQVMR